MGKANARNKAKRKKLTELTALPCMFELFLFMVKLLLAKVAA